jgi:hypothetical protein
MALNCGDSHPAELDEIFLAFSFYNVGINNLETTGGLYLQLATLCWKGGGN